MIEMRSNIKGFYKGLIYCSSLEEASDISDLINALVKSNISRDLISTVKRGCSEYYLEFPEYKKISKSHNNRMNYNQEWYKIEEEIDKENNDWGKAQKSIDGLNLNNFLIMRNWIGYAQKIGDKSFSKITNEKIQVPNRIRKLTRALNLN